MIGRRWPSGSPAQAIEGIAYTAGPGLIGALAGRRLRRALAGAMPGICRSSACTTWRGTCLRPQLEPGRAEFPCCGAASLGRPHVLVEVRGVGSYRILGETRDDAAGEAFDKTAKLLGLGYPGRPELAALAERGRDRRLRVPRPMLDRPGPRFQLQRPEDGGRRRRARPRARRRRRAPTSRAASRTRWWIRWSRSRCARSKLTGLDALVDRRRRRRQPTAARASLAKAVAAARRERTFRAPSSAPTTRR